MFLACCCNVLRPLLDFHFKRLDISSSQSDFFKMLDEKVESGPDYDSSCEYEIALEHARLCRLLQEWEAAKQRSARCRAAQSSKAARCYLPAAAAAANGDAMAAQRHATALQWYHHQQPSLQQYYQPPPPHYQFSNSVVMYDKSRGHYYTELA